MNPYKKVGWVDHVVDVETLEIIQEGTPLSQTNMNHMDSGIFENREAVIRHDTVITTQGQEIKKLKDATELLTVQQIATELVKPGNPVSTALSAKADANGIFTAKSLTLHIAKNGSDDTGDGTAARPYLTIQHAVNQMAGKLLGWVSITIHSGTYDEDVTIYGFNGYQLSIEGASGDTVSVKSIYAVNICSDLYINNLTIHGERISDSWLSGGSLIFVRCVKVSIFSVTCTQEQVGGNVGAIFIHYTNYCTINHSEISNKNIAVDVMAGTLYLNYTDTGENNTVGIRCGSGWGSFGGYVQIGGATISGEKQSNYGGQIFKEVRQ